MRHTLRLLPASLLCLLSAAANAVAVPLLAILATSAQSGGHIHAPLVQPRHDGPVERVGGVGQ